MAKVLSFASPTAEVQLDAGGFNISERYTWAGGDGWAICDFIEGPGVVTMQVLSPASTILPRWVDTDVSFSTEDGVGGMKHFKLPPGSVIRVRLTDDLSTTVVACEIRSDVRRRILAS